MAVAGKNIWNKKTRQQIKFVKTSGDTNGELLEMISTYAPASQEPPPHYHPHQDEYFEVLKGEIKIRLDDKVKILKEGDKLHIPKKQIHSMWNNTNDETVVNWKMVPAMDTEYFFETLTGLANDNKTNDAGVPNILQVSLTANKYSRTFRLIKPPYALQKIVFLMLTPIAYITGHKPYYKQYFN